jgi:hypothetical protein
MQFERKVIDKEKGIVQITTEDERWYSMPFEDKVIYLPSTTWICQYYPRGIAYFKWLASKGWDEAEALKEAAGEKGTYTHKACEMLLDGSVVRFDTVVDDRQLTTEEYANVMSFVAWFNEAKPKSIKTEFTVFAPGNTHAGTIDYICEINGETWVIDFKTSASIWPSHIIQLTAYRIALDIECKLGILQLGYKYNKNKKYKLTEVPFKPDLWKAAYTIWEDECKGIVPLQRDYPLELSLNLGGSNATTTENK